LLPRTPLLRSTFVTVRDAETLYTHRRAGLFPSREADYAPLTFERLQAAALVGLDDYLEALAARERLFEAFDRLFDRIDVLIVPVTSTSPPLIKSKSPDVEAWNACGAYTTPFNLLGVPACAVRAGFDELGLPVGVQIVGRYATDALVLSVAQRYYDATPEIQGRWPGEVAACRRSTHCHEEAPRKE
jgi:aspartyl-tRNA(Asn)/glutamyl-tRNA(Gln) amidotransferase subunit A